MLYRLLSKNRSNRYAWVTLLPILFPLMASANTWYVDDDAPNDPGPGDPIISDPDEDGTADHPFDAIQEAINAAASGETVKILAGTYTGSGNRDINPFGKSITIFGVEGAVSTLIDCQGSAASPRRGFSITAGSAGLIIDGLTIANGYQTDGGGMRIFGAAAPTVRNCRFARCTATSRGGGLYIFGTGAPAITDCEFTNNTANFGGGAAESGPGHSVLTGCAFSNNHAGDDGGGAHVASGPASFFGCPFESNTAAQDGGGVMVTDQSQAKFTNCDFRYNAASTDGGGLMVYLGTSNAALTNCAIEGNTASWGGGVALWETTVATSLDACSLEFNSATNNGGGLAVSNAKALISSCAMAQNTAEANGAGLYCGSGAMATITTCVIRENFGSGGGAGVAIHGANTIELSGCDVLQNYGSYAISVAFDAAPLIHNCTINDNWAGAANFLFGGRGTMRDCTIRGNTHSDYAAAFWFIHENSSPVIEFCLIENNTGSAVATCHHQAAPTISHCIVRDNVATSIFGSGGFIHILHEGTAPTIQNCLFESNSAPLGGAGAIFCSYDASPRILQSTFVSNIAGTGGGAIACDSGASPTVATCTMWSNLPNAIYDSDSLASVSYSDIQGGWHGVGNIDADPLFVDAAGGDYRLSAGSPCIDAGDNAAVPSGVTTDLAGRPRFVDDPDTADTGVGTPPIVDMGAYEFQPQCEEPGDLDGDCDVDLDDYELFAGCLAGPGQSSMPECRPADSDGDGDIDLLDFAAFQIPFGK